MDEITQPLTTLSLTPTASTANMSADAKNFVSIQSNQNNSEFTMWDTLFLRFPYIAEKILNQLECRDLKNCKIVSMSWNKYLEKQKFYWIKWIKFFIFFPKKYQKIFRMSSVESIRQYAFEVKRFYNNEASEVGQTPIHFAAMTGQIQFLHSLIEQIGKRALLFKGWFPVALTSNILSQDFQS